MASNKIWIFLLASITLHVIVISLARDKNDLFIPSGSTLKVRLVTSINTAEGTAEIVQKNKPNKPNKPNKQESPENHPQVAEVEIRTVPSTQIKPIQTHAPPLATLDVAPMDSQLVAETIPSAFNDIPSPELANNAHTFADIDTTDKQALLYIQDELAKHFNYPRIAVAKGWQGKVLLGFQLKRNGMIENIYIAKSSGYAILDRAASKALANIQPITQTNIWFNDTFSDLQLPVIYKLQEG